MFGVPEPQYIHLGLNDFVYSVRLNTQTIGQYSYAHIIGLFSDAHWPAIDCWTCCICGCRLHRTSQLSSVSYVNWIRVLIT